MNRAISEHVLNLKRVRSGLDILAGMVEDRICGPGLLTEDDHHGLLALLQSLAERLDTEADRFEAEFSAMELINNAKEMTA